MQAWRKRAFLGGGFKGANESNVVPPRSPKPAAASYDGQTEAHCIPTGNTIQTRDNRARRGSTVSVERESERRGAAAVGREAGQSKATKKSNERAK